MACPSVNHYRHHFDEMPVFPDLPHVVALSGVTFFAPYEFLPIEDFLRSDEANGYHHEFWIDTPHVKNRVVIVADPRVYFAFSDAATAVALKLKFG